MARYLFAIRISVIASLAGFLFGYDTAVIAGAIGFLTQNFGLGPVQTGFAVSSALIGCVIGAAVSGWIGDRLGRRKTLFLAGALYSLSAIGAALAWDFDSFWIARVVGGLGIGLSAIVPAYISEISPANIRGRLTSVYQLAITVGILTIYIVNNAIASSGDSQWQITTSWRFMLGSELIPAVLFLILLLALPESPRWLMARGQDRQAEAILRKLDASMEARELMVEIREDLDHEQQSKAVRIFGRKLIGITLLACAIAALQQFVGINVIIYYGTSLLGQMNVADPFLQQVLIGSVNVVATLLGMALVDRWGRRPLLVLGGAGVTVMIAVVGFANLTQTTGPWVMIFIVGYVVVFAATLGPVAWLIIAELAPSLARAKVVALATMVLWTANVLVAQTFPMINESRVNVEVFNGALPYFVYAVFGVLMLLVSWFAVKETKGLSLEKLSRRAVRTSDAKLPAQDNG
ncbi:MAG: sugar porter family MFS transporter [Renibacterium salmoninarum]|nr:sugar porter family MFS transporter [Renibacterium salmoninarum]